MLRRLVVIVAISLYNIVVHTTTQKKKRGRGRESGEGWEREMKKGENKLAIAPEFKIGRLTRSIVAFAVESPRCKSRNDAVSRSIRLTPLNPGQWMADGMREGCASRFAGKRSIRSTTDGGAICSRGLAPLMRVENQWPAMPSVDPPLIVVRFHANTLTSLRIAVRDRGSYAVIVSGLQIGRAHV